VVLWYVVFPLDLDSNKFECLRKVGSPVKELDAYATELSLPPKFLQIAM
jgi:hypothetical protein